MVKGSSDVVVSAEESYGSLRTSSTSYTSSSRGLLGRRFRHIAAVVGVCILCLAVLSFQATADEQSELDSALHEQEQLLHQQGRAFVSPKAAVRSHAASKLSFRARAAIRRAVNSAPSMFHSDIGEDALRLEAIQNLAHVEMELHNPDMGNGDTMHLRQEEIRDKRRLAQFSNDAQTAEKDEQTDEIAI